MIHHTKPADDALGPPCGWNRARLAKHLAPGLPPLAAVTRLLSVPEVAAYLGLCQRQIRQQIALGRGRPGRGLPCITVGTRSVRVDPDDLRAYVNQRRSTTTAKERGA